MKSKNGGLLRMPALKGVSYSFGRLQLNELFEQNTSKAPYSQTSMSPDICRIEINDK